MNAHDRPDAVVLNRPSPAKAAVSILVGAGGGAFASRLEIALPVLPENLACEGISCGDVTGDGRPDILVLGYALRLTYGAYVTVIQSDASSGFTVRSPLRLGTERATFAASVAGDFNNDGQVDVADGRGGFGPGPSRPASLLPSTFS